MRIQYYFFSLLLAFFWGMPAWGQDDGEAAALAETSTPCHAIEDGREADTVEASGDGSAADTGGGSST